MLTTVDPDKKIFLLQTKFKQRYLWSFHKTCISKPPIRLHEASTLKFIKNNANPKFNQSFSICIIHGVEPSKRLKLLSKFT